VTQYIVTHHRCDASFPRRRESSEIAFRYELFLLLDYKLRRAVCPKAIDQRLLFASASCLRDPAYAGMTLLIVFFVIK